MMPGQGGCRSTRARRATQGTSDERYDNYGETIVG
jgi:hypothetical protein